MGKPHLLVVEDDRDIANMLQIYFSGQQYDVDVASRGSEALERTRQVMPHLIILDIMLPDIDGYEVCRRLRTTTRTSHVPIIFLTQRDERSDKLKGLELGADDYIIKPFDIIELKWRVQNAISRSERESLTDPLTGLPAGRLIEEQLRKAIRSTGWAFMDIHIDHFFAFKEVYGFIAANDVLRYTAMLLGEVIDQLGTEEDFIGSSGGENFVIITSETIAPAIGQLLKKKFSEEILIHYNFIDRQQGFLQSENPGGKPEQHAFMCLDIGIVSPTRYQFADIREITELAAEARRKDAGTSQAANNFNSPGDSSTS
jgi:PleD family two-component response regulator